MEVGGRIRYEQDEGDECARVLARYIPAATITNTVIFPPTTHIRDWPIERRWTSR